MSIDYLERFSAQISLNLSLIKSDWNWPSEEALGQAARSRSAEQIAAINSDVELFSRTGLKSCRLVKFLRDALDADWEIQNTGPAPLKAAS